MSGFQQIAANPDVLRSVFEAAGTQTDGMKKRKWDGDRSQDMPPRRRAKVSAYNMFMREEHAKVLSGAERGKEWSAIKANSAAFDKYQARANEENTLLASETVEETQARRRKFAIERRDAKKVRMLSMDATMAELNATHNLHWKNQASIGLHAVPYKTETHLRLTPTERALYRKMYEYRIYAERLAFRIGGLAGALHTLKQRPWLADEME